MATNTLQEWFTTPLGQYLLEKERAYLDEVTPDIFGFHALQVGMPEVDLLRENRITHKLRVARAGPPDVFAQCHELPFATHSIDLVLLPSEPWEFDAGQLEGLRGSRTFAAARLELCDGRDYCWHGVRMADGLGRALASMARLCGARP